MRVRPSPPAPEYRFPLDPPQRPPQAAQGDDLLLFLFAQDIAHLTERNASVINVLTQSSIGRFSGDPVWPVLGDPRGRILRLIQKWLKAGVMEEGQWSETEMGTPQGAVISPLLANIYLHYVFDLWVDVWRKKCAQGDVIVIRYADDSVLGFQHRAEADRFLGDLRERLGKFGLDPPSRQDAPDRVRAVCRTGPETERGRQARDVRFSGVHAHQREDPVWALYREAPDSGQAHASQA